MVSGNHRLPDGEVQRLLQKENDCLKDLQEKYDRKLQECGVRSLMHIMSVNVSLKVIGNFHNFSKVQLDLVIHINYKYKITKYT